MADGNPDAPANPDDDGDGNQLTATGSIAGAGLGRRRSGWRVYPRRLGPVRPDRPGAGIERPGAVLLRLRRYADRLYRRGARATATSSPCSFPPTAIMSSPCSDQLDHPAADGNDDELLAIDFGSIVDVADADGDVLELAGGFVINVEDDVPVAEEALVEGFVYEDGTGPTAIPIRRPTRTMTATGNPLTRHRLDRGAGFGRRRSGWRVYPRRLRSVRPDRPGADLERSGAEL